METRLITGDSLEVLKGLEANSVDSIVTDPPYGLSFMGKRWDYDVPSVAIWEQCLRVLKPGGHLLAFAGTRTQHRMCVNIEDAGFEIKDLIMWCYGSGFPKSHNISKAIDKAAGAEREVIGDSPYASRKPNGSAGVNSVGLNATPGSVITAPATPEAQQWEGWGTALKPALEPITVARKPIKGTVAGNVLEHGTGAINIDGCRVATDERIASHYMAAGGAGHTTGKFNDIYQSGDAGDHNLQDKGRWPANLIHDGSEEVTELFPHSISTGGSGAASKSYKGEGRTISGSCAATGGFGDRGSAARFFYCAKASKKDRGEGNTHPTVKPTDLMAYLVRLVTPPGGVVLDPFMGSGSTGKACVREGFDFIGVDLDPVYVEIAEQRINNAACELSR